MKLLADWIPWLVHSAKGRILLPGPFIAGGFIRTQAEAKDADTSTRIAFFRQVGLAGSAAEHKVPEQLFRDPNKPENDPSLRVWEQVLYSYYQFFFWVNSLQHQHSLFLLLE